ncbi:hypothetical protein RRG08_019748 [Elysia crispata]|uniref:Uncharacterized protein n=1 Tax=Elysia crispata TaxID=231223 RepID=A0AAE0Y754_9GAST|nr:hypothetical protein RRG08_019748 [Elysia crispata]
MRSRVKKYVLSLAGLTFILIVAWTSVTHTLPGATTVQPDSFQDQRGKILRFLPHIGQLISNSDTQKCPDILSGMTRGKWKTRVLSNQEQKDIDSYLLEERGAFRMPVDFQRSDGKCGNVTYEYAPLYRHMWFKAICGARGATPCCRDNR